MIKWQMDYYKAEWSRKFKCKALFQVNHKIGGLIWVYLI